MTQLYNAVVHGGAGQSRSSKSKIVARTWRLIGVASMVTMLLIATFDLLRWSL